MHRRRVFKSHFTSDSDRGDSIRELTRTERFFDQVPTIRPAKMLDREARLAKLMGSAMFGNPDAPSQPDSATPATAPPAPGTPAPSSESRQQQASASEASRAQAESLKPKPKQAANSKVVATTRKRRSSEEVIDLSGTERGASTGGSRASRTATGSNETGGSARVLQPPRRLTNSPATRAALGAARAALERGVPHPGPPAAARPTSSSSSRAAATMGTGSGVSGLRRPATTRRAGGENAAPNSKAKPKPVVSGVRNAATLSALGASSSGATSSRPASSRSSRLHQTTESFRRQNGTTAQSVQDVGAGTMTADKRRKVHKARKTAGKPPLTSGGGAGGAAGSSRGGGGAGGGSSGRPGGVAGGTGAAGSGLGPRANVVTLGDSTAASSSANNRGRGRMVTTGGRSRSGIRN